MANRELDKAAGFPVRVGDKIEVEFTSPEAFSFGGEVADIDDDFIVLLEGPRKTEQEYVLHADFYGAHGDLDGIIDALLDGRAVIYSDRD